MKRTEIYERAILVGEYVVEHHATVRGTAKEFKVSKSTVHKDISERLPKVSVSLYTEASAVIAANKEERHIRGGEATHQKYLVLKKAHA